MTGPHRRKQWTPRTVRRMLRDPDGFGGDNGPRPFLLIVIPGKIGEATEHKNNLYIDRHGPITTDLLSKIGYTVQSKYGYDCDHPPGLKYFDVGVWRGRFVVTCCLYSRDPRHDYPGELIHIADFINQIQKSAGSLATVYGRFHRMDRWSDNRYRKTMAFHRYFELHRKYPEPRKYSQ